MIFFRNINCFLQSDQIKIKQYPVSKLTFVVGISGQPFAFGAVGGANDADCVPCLHRQVILADFTGHHHLGVVHGLLITSHLDSKILSNQRLWFTMILEQLNGPL